MTTMRRVLIVSYSCFRCLFDNAKKSFYRVFNAVFGKVGRVASQKVVIELLMSKCVPAFYYGSECCPISNSLEFAIRGSFMKIFDTRSKDIVFYSMKVFNMQSPYHDIIKRKYTFLHNIMSSANLLCQICKDFAAKELHNNYGRPAQPDADIKFLPCGFFFYFFIA